MNTNRESLDEADRINCDERHSRLQTDLRLAYQHYDLCGYEKTTARPPKKRQDEAGHFALVA